MATTDPATWTVRAGSSCLPIAGARVSFLSANGEVLDAHRTSRSGRLDAHLPEDARFVEVDAVGYSSRRLALDSLTSRDVRLLESRVVAYQSLLAYDPNNLVTAFVHSPMRFTASLRRHGSSLETLREWPAFEPQLQALPCGHFVATGLQWTPTFEYQLDASARPGLYSLLVEDGENSHAVPMVVRTATESRGQSSRLLVLANTNTWQCYNLWGGRNRYRSYESEAPDPGMPDGPNRNVAHAFARRLFGALPDNTRSAVRRALGRTDRHEPAELFQPLSIQRPSVGCDLELDGPDAPFEGHLANAEWRLLAWLERRGIAYDYCDDAALESEPELLDAYSAVILSTHSEYWSNRMYDALRERHLRSRLWVLNLSGNSIFRRVDLLPEGGVLPRGTYFFESGRDESRMLGARFSDYDYATCAPYFVLRPRHWAFEGVALDASRRVGKDAINRACPADRTLYSPSRPGTPSGLIGRGASGWETDKRTESTPDDFVRLAKGLNPAGGADMLIREPEGSRGGVFSASSITFTSALLVDPVLSRVTENVIQRALLPS